MYNTKALENGIQKCRDNIKVFEDAIDKERETIKEYLRMIEVIEKKERLRAEIKNHVEIDRNGNS